MNKISDLPVVDCHNDTMMKVIDHNTWLPVTDLGGTSNFHIDLEKLNKGGLNAPFFAAYTEGYYKDVPKSLSRTLAIINALYWTEEKNKGAIKISPSYDQIIESVNQGKIAAIPTIEGAYSIDEDNYKYLLNQYYDIGIRVIGFNWNYSNYLGEGAAREYSDNLKTKSQGGLTDLGRKTLSQMEDMGILLDVSHMSENTFWDVMESAKKPIIATHSGVFEIKDHRRNLKDDQILAIKENGGLVGLVPCPAFISYEDEAKLQDLLDHIDYVVKLIGVDHVGIGSDFDGASLPIDLKDSSEYYKIFEGLRSMGYSDKDIRKISGENVLNLLRENESLNLVDRESIVNIEMGQRLNDGFIIFDPEKRCGRVILDGIIVSSGELEYTIKPDLKEKYHIISFEIEVDGRLKRDTKIFYINGR